MPDSLQIKLKKMKSLDTLTQRLNAVDMTTLVRAQKFRIQTNIDPAKRVIAKKKANAVVKKARVNAVVQRPASLVKAVKLQSMAMKKAKKEVKQTLRRRSSRTPARVIKSFLIRARRTRRSLSRSEMSSL